MGIPHGLETSAASLWKIFDLGASLIWALSGALLAARRGYDLIGIFAIALVSSTGGGLLRDAVFLQNGPPILVRTASYLTIATAAAVVVWIGGRRLADIRLMPPVIAITDAVGLGAFAVVGMELARRAGLSAPGVVLVGVVNAVGGSLFRSILLREEPELFRPGAFIATAALIGCLLYLLLTRAFGMDRQLVGVATVALVASLRIASVRYHLRTLPAHGFSFSDTDERKEPLSPR